MQFVLQEDYNVLAFEKVLVNSGLQDLLNFKTSEDVKKDSEVMQGIGILVLLIFLTLLVFTSYMLKFSYRYLSLFERISYNWWTCSSMMIIYPFVGILSHFNDFFSTAFWYKKNIIFFKRKFLFKKRDEYQNAFTVLQKFSIQFIFLSDHDLNKSRNIDDFNVKCY